MRDNHLWHTRPIWPVEPTRSGASVIRPAVRALPRALALFSAWPFLTLQPAHAVELTPALQTQICQHTQAETLPGSAQRWGCYDALPGHPTQVERRAFIDLVGPAAVAAERQYGPPASALTAMALIESGAGFTRMALCSNNLYGFKWVTAKAAEGRPAFSLGCQPAWDTNKNYVAFDRPIDSVLFVASKLSKLDAYSDDTKRFQQDVVKGIDPEIAVRRWVEGIASPYNYDPGRYAAAVLRIINDPITPSDSVNPATTLYRLSAAAVPGPAPAGADLKAHIVTALKTRFASGGRYVIGVETVNNPHQYCSEITSQDDLLKNGVVAPYARLVGSAAAQLLECSYPFPKPQGDRQGWVVVVAATPENMADRIVGACSAAAPTNAFACVDKLLSGDPRYPWGSNNLIYPITGFVREPCKGGENLIGFRHGVTVQYADGPASGRKLDYCVTEAESVERQKEVGLTFGTYEVFNVGRVAALSRDEAKGEGPFPKVEPGSLPGLEADAFQAFVRDNEIEAVETGYDRMMMVKAAIAMGVPIPADRR